MSLLTYNNHNFTYKDNKFNLNEIYQILDYKLLEENSFVDKEELLTLLNEEYDEDKNFINFLNNNFIEPMIDIFTFMNKNKLILSDNEVFNELWHSLKDKKEILITNNLLEFMGFALKSNAGGTSAHVRNRTLKHYIEFLNENNIHFEQINHKDNKANNYQEIQDYIKSADKRTLHSKKWLILSIDNFKESIMMLNNKKAKEVRRYYIQLEKVFYLYSDYVKEYNLKLNEIKYKQEIKEIKNKLKIEKKEYIAKSLNLTNQLKIEQEEKEEYKRKSLRLKNKLIEEKQLKKEEIVYISTSSSYASQNRFKVGGVQDIKHLKPRLSVYNSRSAEGDNWYFTKIEKVNNFRAFENRFWSVMNSFKDQKNKEFIIIYYIDLEKIFNFIMENYNTDIEYFNKNVKEFVENINYNKKIFIPEPLNSEIVNCITIKNGQINNSTLILASKEDIENEIEKYFKYNIINNILEIKKKDVNNFLSLKYKINKHETWNYMKNIKNKFNNIQLFYK